MARVVELWGHISGKLSACQSRAGFEQVACGDTARHG
jgi:hypothetical protein